MKPNLEEYKDRLFEILLSNNHQDGFLNLIENLCFRGHTKIDIYDLFHDFHMEIQVDIRTKENEGLYDRLSEFMDGFTSWGKNFKVLPNEPDL